MDSQLADAYLSDWGVWSNSDIRQGLCATQAWQRNVIRESQTGYEETSEYSVHTITTPFEVLERTDKVVSQVNLRWPAMGGVLKKKYLKRGIVDLDMLNTALLRFVSIWDGHLD